jgi:orotidine 5'-phosphate decarboxylase subfamily 2
MTRTFIDRWQTAIQRAKAPLCVGLDPDPTLIPPHLGGDITGCRDFLFQIIEAVRDDVAAFKPNAAFFEAYGFEGVRLLEELRDRIGPEVLLIVDAKRGDVRHTNEAYARAIFDRMQADAVTVQPYLGGEPLEPFFRDPERGMFVLCATSNPGAEEIQRLQTGNAPLFLEVARLAGRWSPHRNVGLVLGTTKPDAVKAVVEVAPALPYLMPGGGAQGGSTEDIKKILAQAGATGLFTFSRSVLYASRDEHFADSALQEVIRLRESLR